MAASNPPTPILNWVREDDHDVVLTGAVLAGKQVRLQANWQPWGEMYTGPGRFTIRTARSWLGASHKVSEIWADVDGPPRTHSVSVWQTGTTKGPGHQQRYYFTDFQGYRSGPLVVSNVKQYTSEPKFELLAGAEGGFAVGHARLVAQAGRAATKIMIGAVADPTVRVSILDSSSDDTRDDLFSYFPKTLFSRDFPVELLGFRRPTQWHPMFEDGARELVLDVDEDHSAQVTVVPESPSEDDSRPFSTAFAVRVADVNDPEQYVISDIVTVEGGGGLRSYADYPLGTVMFRTHG
jgi:hypothetical protein